MSDFEGAYNPKDVEAKIYELWEKSGYFNPDNLPRAKKPFTIVVPPPNVTGSLHMGHALNGTIQDIIIRRKRMQGFKTLWLPGIDHAGIATQNVVEKELKKQGISRFSLGREKFLEKVWEWKEKYGNIILDQFKKLGCSLDWSRTRFTMDEGYQKAVKEAFLHYYKKGLIYRAERVVNWCTRCKTSLSDLELEHTEEHATLFYIRYPFVDGSGAVIVATTRPETMLGDTAVAVNPKDKRYSSVVGKKVILPIQKREIPIIADRVIDMKFGTGAVKVTPAHDMLDAEIGLRNKLAALQVIGPDGKMTQAAGAAFAGLGIQECRAKILEELKREGLLEKEEPYVHNVSVCYRCGGVIEPMPSLQWFLKMETLAKLAIKEVRGIRPHVLFHPKKWEKVFTEWLTGVRDWCISRQIWWGHQIPAWICEAPQGAKKMGFHESVVPQLFDDKVSTWRLRDHGFKAGDRVMFENSQTKEIIGYGIITLAEATTVGDIDLQDKTHYKTYKTRAELIKRLKYHHPEMEVNEKTPAFAYKYTFEKIKPEDGGCGHINVSEIEPKACENCGSRKLTQASDVLDTWFSSALWPFATLGWPDKTKNLATFYPTQILSTARDIMNLWVARMIFSGMEFTGKAPFQDVIVHATVLTKTGERMSKSKGTGIDPMSLVENYGADATRFGLIWQAMGGQDIRWSEEHVVAGKKFANKLWNAAKFVHMKLDGANLDSKKPAARTPADRAILSALQKTKKSVDASIEKYDFGKALHTIYDFFWHKFCDVYLEKSKQQFEDTKLKGNTKQILFYTLSESLKMLHPFMPFITEEIWSKLPNREGLLIVEEW